MKRRVLAWVTAAAMLFTSVPGNAVQAFAEEIPEGIVAVDQEELDPAASSGEVLSAEAAEEKTEAVTEDIAVDDTADASAAADDLQPEILEDVSDDAVPGEEIDAPDGLVEDFTVEEDIPEQDAFDEELLIASEDEQSGEELPTAAEDEDPTITDITLNCEDPEEVFVYKEYSDHFLGSLSRLIEASYITSDGEEHYIERYDWHTEEIPVGYKTVSVLTDDTIGVLPYDVASGELILADERCWDRVLYDTSIRLVPYVYNSEEYDRFEDKEVTLTFPTLDSLAKHLQEGAVQTQESDEHQWYELEFGGDSRYKLSLNAEENSSVHIVLYQLSSQGDCLELIYNEYLNPTGTQINKVLPPLNSDTKYYLNVSYEYADDPMQFSIGGMPEISGVSLSDTVIGTDDLRGMDWDEFTALLSGQVNYADGESYPLYDSKWWYSDPEGRPYLAGFTEGNVEVDIYFLDKDTGDAIELNNSNYQSIEAGSYTIQAKCGDYTATANFTIIEGITVSAELTCDTPVEYEIMGRRNFYIHSTLSEPGAYQFKVAASGLTANEMRAELQMFNAEAGTWDYINSRDLYRGSSGMTFDVRLDEGTEAEYRLILQLPDGGEASISNCSRGTVSLVYNEGGSGEAAVPINVGETKPAVWEARDENKLIYSFTPQETGLYTFSSSGSTDLYAELYLAEDDSNRLDYDDDGKDDAFYNFLLTANLEAGNTYLYKVGNYNSSEEVSSTVTLARAYDIQSAELTYDGDVTAFVEGLDSKANGVPLSEAGTLSAAVTYSNGEQEQFSNITNNYIFTKYGIGYDIIAVSGFENGVPLNLTSGGHLPAGEWYAVLAEDNEDDVPSFIPAKAQEGEWTPGLDTVSGIPFTVVTKQEAVSGRVLQQGGSIQLEPEDTYYMGMTLSTLTGGDLTLTSDLALDSVKVYAADDADTSMKVTPANAFTYKVPLEADTSYYLFVKPASVDAFTLSAEGTAVLEDVVIRTDLPSTITTADTVRTEDFGVDLTYGDDTHVHLTGAQKDAYGNSFRYYAEGSDDSFRFSYPGEEYKFSVGHYTVSGQMNVTGSAITSGNSIGFLVEKADAAASITQGSVQTADAGSEATYEFVPDATGYYTVLCDGDPINVRGITSYYDGTIHENDTIYKLRKGREYQITIPAGAARNVSITRRYPVSVAEEASLPVLTKAERTTQYLFTVEEDGLYDLSVEAGAEGKLIMSLYDPENNENPAIVKSSDSGRISFTSFLKAGRAYVLEGLSYPVSAAGEYAMTLNIGKTAPAADVQISLSQETANYPAQFAENYVNQFVKVRETVGEATNDVRFGEVSGLTGYIYNADVSRTGESADISIYYYDSNGRYQRCNKSISFTGDFTAAPSLTVGDASTGGLVLNGSRFFRFIPAETARYQFTAGAFGGNIEVREEDSGHIVTWANQNLVEGRAYLVAYFDPEGSNAAVSVNKAADVAKIEITGQPSGMLLQNLHSGEGFSARITYSGADPETYDLSEAAEDKYGHYISVEGNVLPVPEGSPAMARVVVSAGGRKAHVDVPINTDKAETITTEYGQSADLEANQRKWYIFTPSSDGYYRVEAAAENDSFRWGCGAFAADSTVSMTDPYYMESGQEYIVMIWTYSAGSGVKVKMQKEDETPSSPNLVALNYEFEAASGAPALPEEVTSLKPESAELMKDAEQVIILPEKEVVKTADGVWTFQGYDSTESFVRLDASKTITGTWSYEAAQSYEVSYVFENSAEGEELPASVTALLPESDRYAEGSAVTIKAPTKTVVDTAEGYWSFDGYDGYETGEDITVETSDVQITGTWTYSIEEHAVLYGFSSTDGNELPEEVLDVCPAEGSAVKGTTVLPERPSAEVVTVTDGVWTFTGYSPASAKMRKSDLTFTGYWAFEAGEQYCEHELTYVEAKDSTCTEEGNTAYYLCEKCGRLFADEAGTEELDGDSVVIPMAAHNLELVEATDPTCTEDGNTEYYLCTECGNLFADEEGTEEISEDSVVLSATGHTLEWVEAREATCTEDGNIEYYFCTECGRMFADVEGTEEIYEDVVILPAAGHTLELVEATEPTCTEEGNIEHYFCTKCGSLFADADGTEEIDEEFVVVPKADHILNLVEATEPTADEAGNIEHYHCQNCGRNFSDDTAAEELTDDEIIIPKLGSYNVVFHGNGGYSAEDDTQDVVVVVTTAGETVGAIPEFQHPDGLELLGWTTELQDDDTELADLETYQIDAPTDFYAVWKEKELQTFNVIYQFQSETDRDLPQEILDLQDSMQGGTVLEGESADAQRPDPDEIETDDGYRWYFDYYENDYVDSSSEDITFIGYWNCEQISYTVTFHGNGGYSVDDETLDEVAVEAAAGETVGAIPEFQHPEGLQLAGWREEGEDSEIVDLETYQINAPTDFYAVWKELQTFSVTYEFRPESDRDLPQEILDLQESMKGTVQEGESVDASWPNPSSFETDDGYRWYFDYYSNEYVDEAYEDVTFIGYWYCNEPDGDTKITWHKNFKGSDETCTEWVESQEWLSSATSEWNYDPDVVAAGKIAGGFYVGSTGGELIDATKDDDSHYVITENIDLYVYWVDAITVTWNPMGGFWGDYDPEEEDPDTEPKTERYYVGEWASSNEAGDITGPNENLLLAGWSKNEGGEIWIYNNNSQKLTADMNGAQLYAVYNTPITITLDGGEGSISDDEEASSIITRTIAAGSGLWLYNDLFTKEGAILTGWRLKDNPSQSYEDDQYAVFDSSVTLEAVWGEAATITWNAMGGRWENAYHDYTSPRTFEYAMGEETWGDWVEKDGYALLGWSDKETGGEILVKPGRRYTVSQKHITLYAQWTPGYKVTFNGNGGHTDGAYSETVTTQMVPAGDTLDSYSNFVCEGKAFKGWAADDPNGNPVDSIFNYPINRDITFYAVWVNGYEVTFELCGGKRSYDNAVSYTEMMEEGAALYRTWYSSMLIPPAGKAFAGWSTVEGDDSKLLPEDGSMKLTGPITLYAIWKEGFTVVFDGNGGFFDKEGQESSYTDFILSGQPITSYRVGYHPDASLMFLGFSTTTSRDDLVFNTMLINRDYLINKDQTLYAIWVPFHSVIFDGNGKMINTWDSSDQVVYEQWPDGEGYYDRQKWIIPEELQADFKGWSTTADGKNPFDFEGKTVTSDMTFYAIWDEVEVPKYPVSYEFASSSGEVIPEDALRMMRALVPGESEYEDGTQVEAADLTGKTVDVENGHWTFVSYDKDSAVIEGAPVVFTSTWTFTEETAAVEYVFVSETGGAVPAEVEALKPGNTTAVKGTTVNPVSPDEETVEVDDYNWTFLGYEPASAKAGGEGSKVTFTGTWRAVEKDKEVYYITYEFAPDNLPEEVMALLPAKTAVVEGEKPVCAALARTFVAVTTGEEGNWVFDGFNTDNLPESMSADITVTGTWHFETKAEAADTAAGMISDITGGTDVDSNSLIDALDKADSADVLDQLTENLKDEAGDDQDALNELLADTTTQIDDLLVNGDKITVSTGYGSQTVGAYVSKTIPATDAATGVKVDISGAAATVASVIRNMDTATLMENDSDHYQAEVSIQNVEDTGEKLTLDISLNVENIDTGEVVKNVEPTSPVTITLTLPEDYVGYDLTVIHTNADGSTETIKYSFISGDTQIRFTVSSLSPFKLEKVPAEHVERLEPTCAEAGHIEYWKRRGKMYDAADGGNELTASDIIIPKTGAHTWDAGRVTKRATEDVTGVRTHTCKVCGAKKTAVIPKVKVKITIKSKPAKFKAKKEKKGKVTLTWKKLSKKGKKNKALFNQVKSIEIQYTTDRTFATGVVKKSLSKKKAKLKLKLKPKTTYYIRIRYADGKGGYSQWVKKTVKTKK